MTGPQQAQGNGNAQGIGVNVGETAEAIAARLSLDNDDPVAVLLARKFLNDISTDLATLQGTTRAFAAAVLDFYDARHNIASNKMISPLAMATQTQAARVTAENAINAARDAARAAEVRVRARLEQAENDSAAKLDPVTISTAWTVAQPALRRAAIPAEGVRRVLEATGNDAATIAAMRRYLPVYVAGLYSDPNDIRRNTESAQAVLDQAVGATAGTLARTARQIADQLAAGIANITTGAQLAQMAVTGKSVTSMMPAWARGQAFPVNRAALANLDNGGTFGR